jgi:adenosylcobinamide kinase/adenosylcobinamide-phosphate guanylyltransferase
MQENEGQLRSSGRVRGRIVFITGGARSGKSRYAQEMALQLSAHPIYVATARHWDGDFGERIRRHQKDRDERWTSIEEEKHLSRLDLAGQVAVIDCITLWLTNFFIDTNEDIEASLEACKKEMEALLTQDTVLIIVSNEIGMGVHAETESGRKFTDLQGWMNQYIAQLAEEVILMISGIPMVIKSIK